MKWTSLTGRLALISLLQIVGVFAGAVLVHRAQAPAAHPFLQVPAEMIAVAAAGSWGQPAQLGRHAAVMAERLQIAIEVFDHSGKALVSAGTSQPDLNWMATATVVVAGQAVGNVKVRSANLPRPPPSAWLSTALVAALVLAVSSWLLSRSISKPLHRMAVTAGRLGNGDLAARVGDLHCSGEMKHLAQAFDTMAGRLQTLVTAHNELLANVSHELRTPLARARVALDLAREGSMVDREAMAEITSDLDELEHLIAEVLTTARLSLAQGQASDALARLPKAPLDLGAMAKEAAERFRRQYEQIPFEMQCIAGPLVIEAAEPLLRRALNNLLDNAAGHGAGAAVKLTVAADGPWLSVEVADSGPGMRPEDAARAFEPFFRADPSRSKISGLGLGLTLARRVAEAHGGTATLRSQLGAGTVVRMELPRSVGGFGPAIEQLVR